MRKRLLSVLLTFVMVLTLVPVTVLADGTQGETPADPPASTDKLDVQPIIVRGDGVEDGVENVKYSEAYQKAGLTLSEQPVDGVYTLKIEKAELEAVVAAAETDEGRETYNTLENAGNPGKLWFGMEYIAPTEAQGALKASVIFDDSTIPVEVALNNKDGNGFYNYIKVYDKDATDVDKIGPVKGETAVIQWLGQDGAELTRTKAEIKVVVNAGGTTDPEMYTVTFNSNGGSAVASASVADGGNVEEPDPPTKKDYTFVGWFKDENLTAEWDFKTDTVTENITLYAKWEEDKGQEPGGEDPKPSTEYTITFDANGGSVTPTSGTTKDGKLTELPTPTRTGYTFDGWYTAASGGDLVKEDRVYTADTKLYAHWTRTGTTTPEQYYISIYSGIRHGDVYTSHWYAEPGTEVTITVDPDSGYQVDWVEAERADGRSLYLDRNGRRYTFTMPASNVMVDARFVRYDSYYYTTFYLPEEPVQNTFVPSAPSITWRPAAALWDVPAYSWAYTSAQWAYQNGYLDTAADGTFRLNDPVSHQQMWKIMARWLGGPVADERGVASWARQMGAAQGKPAASAMTRQNMVDYLYQCYFLMGGDVSVTGNLSGYQDSRLITSAPAQNAWLWAVNRGIISGTAEGYLNPNGVVSRGEFATILMRLCQNVMQ